MGAMTKAELEAMVKRLQKSLDRAEAKNLTLINSLKRANAKNKSLGKSVVEGRAREKATSEILGVISQSPTDVAPVFETIMKSAVRLCGSPLAGILRFDGGLLHVAGTHNWPSEARLSSRFPCAPNSSTTAGRAILAKSVVHISDALVDPHYDRSFAATGHWRRRSSARTPPPVWRASAGTRASGW